MKKALIIIGGFVVFVIAALLIVPALIPVETYRTQIVSQVEKATGREARIDGDFSLSLLPRVALEAGDVSLANAQGMQPDKMVTLDRMTVRVAVFPLLSGRVEIDSFVLQKPVINLAIDREGRPNWQFGARKEAAEPAPAPDQDGGSDGFSPSDIRLGDVRLVDGRITYADARSGVSQTIEDIDMTLALTALSEPLKANGSLVWNGERVELSLDAADPEAFLNGRTTTVAASVSGKPVRLSFNGEASQGQTARAKGRLDLDVPSVRRLAAWAGKPLDAPGQGLGPLKIAGNVDVDGARIGFSDAKLALDAMEASGEFRFDGTGPRPFIGAKLAAGQLDLNPYLPPDAEQKQPAPPGRAPQAGPPPAEGWSDEPLDLAVLRTADAELDLRLEGLAIRKIRIGRSQAAVRLKAGKLSTDLTEMALYQGNGSARIVVDASGQTPAVNGAFDVSGVQANPLLTDVMGFDRVEGTANAGLQLQSRGASQRALVSALGGEGKMEFRDGAVNGINIAALLRQARGAFLDPSAREVQKTDFSRLAGTFAIRNGVLRNDDLTLQSPLLRVTGRGSADLPQRTVDYRLEPRLVASAEGQGGRDAAGVMIPILIQGPWSNVSYRPDIAGAVGDISRNPEKALDRLKEVLPGSGSDGEKTPSSPTDTLKKLFGR